MTNYYEFLDEYRETSKKVLHQKEFDSKLFSKFMKEDKFFHSMEDINIEGYRLFLKLAFSFNGPIHVAIVDDKNYPEYKIAILKNWRKDGDGRIDLTFAFPSDPIMPLYERIARTSLNSEPIIDGYTDFEEIESFIDQRLVATYEDVMRYRFIDGYTSDCGEGNLKVWPFYLVVPEAEGEGENQ